MSDDSQQPIDERRPFRVLSLDGGGMRGIYTAAFLDRMVTYFSKERGVGSLDLGKGFDLITGTSTGAIVACALAVGRPLDDVISLYRKHGPHIFPLRIKGVFSALVRIPLGPLAVWYGDRALRSALTEVLEDITMNDVYQKRGISLSIPTINMGSHRAWVFKKTSTSGPRDEDYPLVDVCLATSAAPIFRSLASIADPNSKNGPPNVFADGGLWANNPVLVGLVDALQCTPPSRPIEIFSLGTCPRPEGEHITPFEAHRSILGWKLGADVAPLSISAQEYAFDNMARLLAGSLSQLGRSVHCVRFPNDKIPAEMMKFLALDDTRKKAMDCLVHQAHRDADVAKSAADDARNAQGLMIRRLMESLPEMPATGIDKGIFK